MNPQHDNDATLMQLLADTLAAVEPVPADALAAAYAAADLRTIEEELAVLVFDSGGVGELVGMRGPDVDVRVLSFVHDDVTLDLQVGAEGETTIGQVTPALITRVRVENDRGAVVEATLDGAGRFRAETPPGALRVRLVGVLVTPWITPG
jgi:hypothetical protein